MRFSKLNLGHPFATQFFQVAMAIVFVLGPITEFHHHEEDHACAQLGAESYHLEHIAQVAALGLDQDAQLIPAMLGEAHSHPWCALCWFPVGKSTFQSAEPISRHLSAKSLATQGLSLATINCFTQHQRGPPSDEATT